MVLDRGFGVWTWIPRTPLGSVFRTLDRGHSDTIPAMRAALALRPPHSGSGSRRDGVPEYRHRTCSVAHLLTPVDMQMVSLTLRVMSRPDMTHLPKIYQSLGQE
jgi:hypothetical protein